MYNYYNYFEPCALNAEFQHSYPDLIQLPYFADLAQRKESQRQGEERMTLWISLMKTKYMNLVILTFFSPPPFFITENLQNKFF
jgi:hypothetical protein